MAKRHWYPQLTSAVAKKGKDLPSLQTLLLHKKQVLVLT